MGSQSARDEELPERLVLMADRVRQLRTELEEDPRPIAREVLWEVQVLCRWTWGLWETALASFTGELLEQESLFQVDL